MSQIINSKLSNQTKFRLNEINKIKCYFLSFKRERVKKLVNKLLHSIILTKL